VQNFDLPVGTGFRRQDLFDNRDPHFAGDIGIGINPRLAQRVRDADLVLAVGTRLGETTTSDYKLLGVPRPAQKLIHVHADHHELGRVYLADLMINAGVCEFAQALTLLPAPRTLAWHGWTQAANKDYQEYVQPGAMPGTLDLGAVMVWLREHLPADAIITNGAGNYTGWIHRFYQYTGLRTQLAPASGVMGYGVPAAISAKLVHPQRTVVCFAGDGCFMMNSQELATVKQNKLPIVFLVVNNAMYGSIRMHQELHYPGKVYGTELDNPDFAALAKSYGLDGQIVEHTKDFPAAFERAIACGKGALIELRVSSRALTPRLSLPDSAPAHHS
jgi:acetolactate synthase-1/2/3 large subunit